MAWFENHLVVLGDGSEKKVVHVHEIPTLRLMGWTEFVEYSLAHADEFYPYADFSADYPTQWRVAQIDGAPSLVGFNGVDFLKNHEYAREWAYHALHSVPK